MPAIDQMRLMGSRYGSQYEDPSMVRNPYRLREALDNEELRGARVRNDMAERAANPENARIDAIRAQQDADYDLEYRAPRRIDMMGANAVRGQGWANRQQESAAEGFFDPYRSKQREHEEEFKDRLYSQQYGMGARARMYGADSAYQRSVDTARINADARRDTARTGQMGRVRPQLTDELTGKPTPGNEGRVAAVDQQLGLTQGDKPFPVGMLQQFADENFGGNAADAEDFLANQGYFIAYD